MIVFSFQTKGSTRGPQMLVFVIEKENLERMQQADPFDLKLKVQGAMDRNLDLNRPIRDLDIVVAYEEDLGSIIRFKEANDLAGLMRWLERGHKMLPGDLAPPTMLRRQ